MIPPTVRTLQRLREAGDMDAYEAAYSDTEQDLRELRRRERISRTVQAKWADEDTRSRIIEGRRRWLDSREEAVWRECTAPGCDRDRVAKGLCRKHYNRARSAR